MIKFVSLHLIEKFEICMEHDGVYSSNNSIGESLKKRKISMKALYICNIKWGMIFTKLMFELRLFCSQ